jgi:hypothetical protein
MCNSKADLSEFSENGQGATIEGMFQITRREVAGMSLNSLFCMT